MKFNAFKVSNELTIKIDSAPVLNEFMKSQTSLPFFNNEEYFKTFIQELQLKKILIQVLIIFQCYRILLTSILKIKKST